MCSSMPGKGRRGRRLRCTPRDRSRPPARPLARLTSRDMQLRWLEKFLAGKDDDSLVGACLCKSRVYYARAKDQSVRLYFVELLPIEKPRPSQGEKRVE